METTFLRPSRFVEQDSDLVLELGCIDLKFELLPLQIFYPDTSDVYDRKNMPKLIYCIHALSLFLHKLGKAPLIQNLVGKAQFTGALYNVDYMRISTNLIVCAVLLCYIFVSYA